MSDGDRRRFVVRASALPALGFPAVSATLDSIRKAVLTDPDEAFKVDMPAFLRGPRANFGRR